MLKLHVGCGRVIKEGYVNIDVKPSKGITLDMIRDCTELPYEDNSVDLIESFHLIEHLDRHKALRAMKHWYALLKPRGRLVIECPDFELAVQDYVNGNKKRIDNIFGLQRNPYDFHFFGYSRKSLERILRGFGFKRVIQQQPTDYHKDQEPCLRVVAIK